MAYSYVNYTGNGTTSVFTVPFAFLDRTNVKVKIDDIAITDWVWITDASIRLATAPPKGVVLRIQRFTEKLFSVVDFQDGSVFKEADLDLMVTQLLFIAQEAYDALDGETAVAAKEKAEKILAEVQVLYGKTKAEIDYFRKMYIDVKESETAPGRGEYNFETGRLTLYVPAGPLGPQGPQGAEGAQGLPGATGPQGPRGIQGIQGAQGERGPEGAQGLMGPQGVQGPRGETGAVGPQGIQGIKGDTGERGPRGPEGSKGMTGDKGPLGDSPLPFSFGNFRVGKDGYLYIDHYGNASSNDFNINVDTGMLEVTI